MNPILHQIEVRLQVDDRAQVLAILDDIEINTGIQWPKFAFDVATEVLEEINIQTVLRKSHVLFRQSQPHLIPASINPQICFTTMA